MPACAGEAGVRGASGQPLQSAAAGEAWLVQGSCIAVTAVAGAAGSCRLPDDPDGFKKLILKVPAPGQRNFRGSHTAAV